MLKSVHHLKDELISILNLSQFRPSSTTTATTASVKTCHKFDWIISDFYARYTDGKKSVDKIQSPMFDVTHKNGSVSSWSVYVAGKDGDIALSLRCVKAEHAAEPIDKIDAHIRCQFSLCFGSKLRSRMYEKKSSIAKSFKRTGQVLGWEHFISLEALHEQRGKLLQGGKLRVRALLRIFEEEEKKPSPPDPMRTLKQKAARLAAKESSALLKAMWKDKTFTDATLTCGEEEFKVHKAVLTCRSKVFFKMFTTDMDEASSGVVHIDDLDPATLKFILRYMYTASVTELKAESTLLSVIYGAEKYGLDELKHYCFDKLVACINEQSAGGLAVAAHLYGAKPGIVNAIRKYLARDFVKRICTDEEFRELVTRYPLAFH